MVASFEAGGWTVAPPIAHGVAGAAAEAWIAPAHLVHAARALRDAGYFYESLTCTDRLATHQGFELLHTFNRFDAAQRVAVRTLVPHGEAAPSLADIYGIAAWNEREAWEFYGLSFAGHPGLTWLLLPDDTDFHPLLKSFTAPPPSIYDDSMNAPAPEGTPPEHAGRG